MERVPLAELRALIAMGANPYWWRDGTGFTLLMRAACAGHAHCVEWLLPQSDPKARDNDGWSALLRASYERQVDCVRLLAPVSDHGTCVNDSPLWGAAFTRNAGSISALLPYSDPDAIKDDDGFTPLLWLARSGCVSGVSAALARSDPLVQSNDGSSALMLAVMCRSEECVSALLPVSDLDALDARGLSALDHALKAGDAGITGRLMCARDAIALERAVPQSGAERLALRV